MPKKTNQEHMKDCQARLREIDEQTTATKAKLEAARKAGAEERKTALPRLEKLLLELCQHRKLVESQKKKLWRKMDINAKIVFGAIAMDHFQNNPSELPPEMLEALMADKSTLRNSELTGLTLLLHRTARPNTHLEEIAKWSGQAPEGPPLWSQPNSVPKRRAPRASATRQEPEKTSEQQAPAPAPTPDPLQQAHIDRPFFLALLAKTESDWNSAVAENVSLKTKHADWEEAQARRAPTELVGDLDEKRADLEEQKNNLGRISIRRRKDLEGKIADNLTERSEFVAAEKRIMDQLAEKRAGIHDGALSDTKGQKPELFAMLNALGKIGQQWEARDRAQGTPDHLRE